MNLIFRSRFERKCVKVINSPPNSIGAIYSAAVQTLQLFRPALVLQKSQTSLHDDVLQDTSWWHVDGAALCRHNDDGSLEGDTAAEVDSTGNGKVVELDDLWDAWDTGLEAGNLLEVVSELDKGSVTESVGVHHELAVLQSV